MQMGCGNHLIYPVAALGCSDQLCKERERKTLWIDQWSGGHRFGWEHTRRRVSVTAVLLHHAAVLLSLPTLLSWLQPVKSQIVALVFCLCTPMNTLRGQSWKWGLAFFCQRATWDRCCQRVLFEIESELLVANAVVARSQWRRILIEIVFDFPASLQQRKICMSHARPSAAKDVNFL